MFLPQCRYLLEEDECMRFADIMVNILPQAQNSVRIVPCVLSERFPRHQVEILWLISRNVISVFMVILQPLILCYMIPKARIEQIRVKHCRSNKFFLLSLLLGWALYQQFWYRNNKPSIAVRWILNWEEPIKRLHNYMKIFRLKLGRTLSYNHRSRLRF